MRQSFLPSTDAGLLAWSANFKHLITLTPTAYGLVAAQATAYGTLNDAFATAMTACDPGVRTKSAVATKNAARSALMTSARQLASIIQGQTNVTDAQKIQLGLNVRKTPAPIPAPTVAPGLDIGSVNAWTVKIRLHDGASAKKRGKPAGVSGASVFSFVGATAPTDLSKWNFEGNTGRTGIDVTFASNVPAGATVWFTAFWFNGRKQSGPACAPVSTNLQGGSVSMAA